MSVRPIARSAALSLALALSAPYGHALLRPTDDEKAMAAPPQPSPYRWFMLFGFIGGGLWTAWRLRRKSK